jgi:hypothetical protein
MIECDALVLVFPAKGWDPISAVGTGLRQCGGILM